MEKKKILPKAKLNAMQQEQLLQKLQANTENSVLTQNNTELSVLAQQNTENTVQTQQNTEIPIIIQNNTEFSVPIQNDTEISVLIQKNTEKTVQIQKNTVTKTYAKDTQRVTLDIPIEIYERMKSELDYNGQTIKGFMVNLMRSHFAKK